MNEALPEIVTSFKDIQPGMIFNGDPESDWVVLRLAIEGELCHDNTNKVPYVKVNKNRGYLWWCKDLRASDYAAHLICFSDLRPETASQYNMRMP